MSYERGLKALNLELTDRIPHTEYCSNAALIREMTGLDISKPEEAHRAFQKFYEVTDYDFFWNANDGPEWKGRVTSMGHAEFLEGGTDYDARIFCPFKSEEEVLSFDPVAEFGLPDIHERAKVFQESIDFNRREFPMGVWPGGYYKTLFSACIHVFGWEMFLAGAALDEERFDKVLEGFYQISLANYRAWAETDMKFFVCHDDIVWSSGAVFHPNWYRKHIFPRYRKLWRFLKEKGIKVLFCSDGDFTEFVDDLVEAGAEGFIFEPLTSLEYIAGKYGRTHIMIGNVDCRVLTFGTREKIYQDVKRCADIGRDLPGYFFAVGNHIPSNVPVENALYYFQLIRELGKRS